MATESRNRVTARYGWAIALAAALAAVMLLVLVYRATEPKTAQTVAPNGESIPESDVLRVGALPVT